MFLCVILFCLYNQSTADSWDVFFIVFGAVLYETITKTTHRKVFACFHGYMYWFPQAPHYIDVIMTTMASQITSLTVVYSTVYSDADQRKHQSSASLAFVWGIHRDQWIPRTKGQLRGKCFHLMTSSYVIPCGATFILCGHEYNCFCQIDNYFLLLTIQTGLLYTYLWNVQVVWTCLSLLRNMNMTFWPNAVSPTLSVEVKWAWDVTDCSFAERLSAIKATKLILRSFIFFNVKSPYGGDKTIQI